MTVAQMEMCRHCGRMIVPFSGRLANGWRRFLNRPVMLADGPDVCLPGKTHKPVR